MASSGEEEQWGFTEVELQHCIKVLLILREKPSLFLESDLLRSTGLQWMINRSRLYRKENGEVFNKLEKQALKEKRTQVAQADRAKLEKTLLRRERDQALKNLLEIQGSSTIIPQIESKYEDTEISVEVAQVFDYKTGFEEDPKDAVITEENELNRLRKCHVCKHAFNELHHFYFAMCPPCAALNWSKRSIKVDLTGKTILLTGSRIKIGQQICLSLLRNGATVIATTRFAVDLAQRYAEIEDFSEWSNRLHIYRLDLRNLWLVKEFCNFLNQHYKNLYAIVNNAAQTVARPPSYYYNLIKKEAIAINLIENSCTEPKSEPQKSYYVPCVDSAWEQFVQKSQGLYFQCTALFPERICEEDESKKTIISSSVSEQQQLNSRAEMMNENNKFSVVAGERKTPIDIAALLRHDGEWFDMYDTQQTATDQRSSNSWTEQLEEISGEEAAETHAINALAPFILNSMLKPLLLPCLSNEEESERKRYIINVSAMEGQFYRHKNANHPHTNMAKASLNMLTRTAAIGYAKNKIYMNSVDTGWITDENPAPKAASRFERGLVCPLDEQDAAARVLDLVYTSSTEYGKFWKDFREIPW